MSQETQNKNCPETQLSWFQINNWVPIIVCIVGLVFSYSGMISEQKLTNQTTNHTKKKHKQKLMLPEPLPPPVKDLIQRFEFRV
jgi:hypothetical protein